MSSVSSSITGVCFFARSLTKNDLGIFVRCCCFWDKILSNEGDLLWVLLLNSWGVFNAFSPSSQIYYNVFWSRNPRQDGGEKTGVLWLPTLQTGKVCGIQALLIWLSLFQSALRESPLSVLPGMTVNLPALFYFFRSLTAWDLFQLLCFRDVDCGAV